MNVMTSNSLQAEEKSAVRVEGSVLIFEQAILTPTEEPVVGDPEGADDRLFDAMQNEVLMRHLAGGMPV